MLIKEKRKEKRLSQSELAQFLGVNQNAVSQWETGRSTPTLDKLLMMSELFGCTLDELVKGEKK